MYSLEQHLSHDVQAAGTKMAGDCCPLRPSRDSERKTSLPQHESPNTVLVAAALDPRFRKLKFLPADDVLKVQNTVQTMVLAAKKKARQPHISENGACTTAQDNQVTHRRKPTMN